MKEGKILHNQFIMYLALLPYVELHYEGEGDIN